MNCRLLSDNEIEIETESSEETEKLGFLLGEGAYPRLSILLRGGLGMGKTVLTKGIGRALGIRKIKSPSFILVSEHIQNLPLAHADLYRLDGAEQVDELDLESYIDEGFLLVVEWAERWQTVLKSDSIDIYFAKNDENSLKRIIRVKASGEKAIDIIARLFSEIGGE